MTVALFHIRVICVHLRILFNFNSVPSVAKYFFIPAFYLFLPFFTFLYFLTLYNPVLILTCCI